MARREAVEVRRDWRDTVEGACDLALLGIVVAIAALPVVTAPAALAAASASVDHWCTHRKLPPVADIARRFVRAVVPGLGVLAVVAVGIALLFADLRAVSRGYVPGGRGLVVVTWLVVALLVGLAGVTVVRVGQLGGRGWLPATAWAWRAALVVPAVPLAAAGCLAVAAVVGWMMPVTVPLLLGIVTFALHAIVRRLVASV
jgi:hypothetical protein